MAEMGRCRDCRWWWWDRDDAEPLPEEAVCELTPSHNVRGPDHPESLARVGGNGEYSVLWTRPDFGCVQFEAKD